MPKRTPRKSDPQATRSAGGKRSGTKTGKKRAKKGAKRKAGTNPTPPVPDPSDADDTETRFVQPYEATKSYLCPGCNRDIPEGLGHLVAVPRSAPDLRRHWHRGCWANRASRY